MPRLTPLILALTLLTAPAATLAAQENATRLRVYPDCNNSVSLDQRQPWGTLEAGAEWSQYLHDLSKSRLEVEGELSLRLARGLSLEVGGSASRIHDQLSLPRRGATSEEVLLRLRELESSFEVQVNFGLRYSFGSIFNNIVNPRFGNR